MRFRSDRVHFVGGFAIQNVFFKLFHSFIFLFEFNFDRLHGFRRIGICSHRSRRQPSQSVAGAENQQKGITGNIRLFTTRSNYFEKTVVPRKRTRAVRPVCGVQEMSRRDFGKNENETAFNERISKQISFFPASAIRVNEENARKSVRENDRTQLRKRCKA